MFFRRITVQSTGIAALKEHRAIVERLSEGRCVLVRDRAVRAAGQARPLRDYGAVRSGYLEESYHGRGRRSSLPVMFFFLVL